MLNLLLCIIFKNKNESISRKQLCERTKKDNCFRESKKAHLLNEIKAGLDYKAVGFLVAMYSFN